MTAPDRWTVVTHAADHTPPAVAAEHLVGWFRRRPDTELTTVVWTAGPRGLAPYGADRRIDVGSVRRRLLSARLERVGLVRLGGGLRGRAVRAALRAVPADGVVYLSSGFAGAVLRYLPDGDRTVITHLHPLDRAADPPLAPGDVDRLVAATDVWLATDDETRAWASSRWGLDRAAVSIVPAPVDPRAWVRPVRTDGRDTLRLGLAGAAWFRTDHTPRLVQALQRIRPGLDLRLVWAQAVVDPRHLDPLRHDLDHLGGRVVLEVPSLSDGPLGALDDIDALALTSPDDEAPWVAWEAASRGVPIVCFDTHRAQPSVVAAGGVVVAYPDVAAMARAVMDIHLDAGEPGAVSEARRAVLVERDVAVVGPRIVRAATDRERS